MIKFGGLRRDRSAMRRVGLRSLVAAAAVLSVGAALLSPVPAVVEAAAAVEAWPAPATASVSRAQASWVGFDSVAAPASQAVAVSLGANSVATAQSLVGAGAGYGPVLAQPGGFGDVIEGAYFSDSVAELAAMGVFDGTECDAGFCPHDPIDRKTMAVWTVRVVTGQDPPAVSESRFDDVDAGGFHAPFIERLAQLRITRGCGESTRFCPDDTVIRAQTAAFLSRAFSLPDGPDPGFGDVASDAWYAADVAALAASGITTGCGDTVFCPDDDTTRAQMATFLHRSLRWAADREAAAVAASSAELSAVPGEATVTPHLGRVFVSWPATEALAGSPVAGYEVQWRVPGEVWDLERRAVVIGLSYEVRGLSGGVREVRVRPAMMERAQVAGASIVSAQGSAPTAALGRACCSD